MPCEPVPAIGSVVADHGTRHSVDGHGGYVVDPRVRPQSPGWRLKQSLASLAVALTLAALLVVGATGATGLSTLQALILVLPVPSIVAVLTVRAGSLVQAGRQTASGIGRIGPETFILVSSTTLGAVFEAALPGMGVLGWLEALALPPWAVILIVIMTMNVAGLFGMHAIVMGTLLLVIFTSVTTGVPTSS